MFEWLTHLSAAVQNVGIIVSAVAVAAGWVLIRVERIVREFKPNGGTSMRDQIAALRDMLSSMSARQWAIVDGLGDPMWESDGQGRCIRANRALLQLSGRSIDQLLDNNWENIVHPDDREAVWNEWKNAVERKRPFEMRYRVVCSGGKAYCVDAIATPILQGQVMSGLVGRYRRVAPESECLTP